MIRSVITYLKAQAAVSAVVGARVFPLKLPAGQSRPAIIVQRISDTNFHHLEGASGLTQTQVQISAYADGPVELNTLRDAIRDEMDGFTGTMSTAVVRGCTKESELDNYEETRVGSDAGLWRNTQSYMITHTETVPTF